ncbi:unnamed protein product, partial [Heterotrigona itama]
MRKQRIKWPSWCSQDSELCISLGLSLQYLRMTVVCWLAAMCHHLYASVASIPRRDDPPTYLKYSLFAWGAPFVNLGVAIFLQIREAASIWNVADLTPFNCWDEGNDLYVRFTRGAAASFRGLLSNQSCDRVQVPLLFPIDDLAPDCQTVVVLYVVRDYSPFPIRSSQTDYRPVNRWISFTQIHVQHAAGNQAAGEDEETKSTADDPVLQSVHDSGPGGWLRCRVQGVESPFPLGRVLHWTLSA